MHSLAFRLAAACATILGTMFLASLPAQASTAHLPGTGSPASHLPTSARHGFHVDKLPEAWHGFAPPAHRYGPVCSNPNVLVNNNSGLVMEVYDSATNYGAEVDQWTYNATLTQGWCFYYEGLWQGTPYYEIVNDNSGLCLDDYGSDTFDGAYVDQWGCNGGGNQQWAIFGGAYPPQVGSLFAPLTVPNTDQGLSYVMEIYNSQLLPGAKVDLWMSNRTLTQSWCPDTCG